MHRAATASRMTLTSISSYWQFCGTLDGEIIRCLPQRQRQFRTRFPLFCAVIRLFCRRFHLVVARTFSKLNELNNEEIFQPFSHFSCLSLFSIATTLWDCFQNVRLERWRRRWQHGIWRGGKSHSTADVDRLETSGSCQYRKHFQGEKFDGTFLALLRAVEKYTILNYWMLITWNFNDDPLSVKTALINSLVPFFPLLLCAY